MSRRPVVRPPPRSLKTETSPVSSCDPCQKGLTQLRRDGAATTGVVPAGPLPTRSRMKVASDRSAAEAAMTAAYSLTGRQVRGSVRTSAHRRSRATSYTTSPPTHCSWPGAPQPPRSAAKTDGHLNAASSRACQSFRGDACQGTVPCARGRTSGQAGFKAAGADRTEV
jgi:hypothetical protein